MSAEEKQFYLEQSNTNRANYEREKHEFDVLKLKKQQEEKNLHVVSAVKARREQKAIEKEQKILAEKEETERLN